MKKVLFLHSLLAFTCIILISGAWAQETSTEEFTLEEITITAEKRTKDIQEVPASVVAISGESLAEEGKVTLAQMLEDVPNLIYGEQMTWKRTMGTPAAAISIRGIKYKQTSDGLPPSATATYVDGVFQGAGTFDIERIELLRGPQGTLYGRSATAGVAAFYTKDPVLLEWGGSASAEIGSANLKNINAAINVPIGDTFAMRVATHYQERDGYYNPEGSHYEIMEGRIKALYNPTDKLDIMLSLVLSDYKPWSGGTVITTLSPTEFDYNANPAIVVEGAKQRTTQASLNVNYDFGPADLTYIVSQRKYSDKDNSGSISVNASSIQMNKIPIPAENYHYQEARLTSNTDGRVSWLIGANFYKADYERSQESIQMMAQEYAGGPWDPDPNTINAIIFSQDVSGKVTNYGIFTEDTLKLTDRLRLTGGLRFDSTEVVASSVFNFNFNVNDNTNSLNPPDFRSYGYNGTRKFHNITYKARLEYDLTPENMLYLLTATGFQPGDIRLQLAMSWAAGVVGPTAVNFYLLPYDEEKLTSYEVGTKNRFLNDKLQVNADLFYYDYEGYRNTISIGEISSIPFLVVTPLRMYGGELDSEWLITANDKVSSSLGWLEGKITDYPMIEAAGVSAQNYMLLSEIPGSSKLTGKLSYEHTFTLPNGSILVPRCELRYTHGMYLGNINQSQLDRGCLPYLYQKSYLLGNLNATWISSGGMYSVSAYMRNVTDKRYKTDVSLSRRSMVHSVTIGDPRTWGMTVSVRF